jgi:predicted nucleic acid-binding protein
MATFYADSSVLVKRHIVELGSGWVVQLFDVALGHQIVTSRLSTVEAISAFNRRVREGTLSLSEYLQLRDDFLALCQRVYRLVPLTNSLLDLTRTLLERHALRSYDALHLAAATITAAQFQQAGLPPLTFLASDARLLLAAQAEGLPTDNPELYP